VSQKCITKRLQNITRQWPLVLLCLVLIQKRELLQHLLDQKWEWKLQVFQEHLNQWKKKKLIIRKPHPNDGRSVLIHLTEIGKTHRALSKVAVIKFNEKILGEIGKESLNNFHFVIEKINELIANKNIFKF